jgi:hypothetical protein
MTVKGAQLLKNGAFDGRREMAQITATPDVRFRELAGRC